MKLSPHIALTFNGQCEAAFKFYERCFGAKIAFMMTWGDSPMAKDAPPEWGSKILYGRLTIGDGDIAGADLPPGGYQQPKGFTVLLNMDDPAQAERVFQSLAENGKVTTPIQQTFWALRYGGVIDQFGIPWEVNCEAPK